MVDIFSRAPDTRNRWWTIPTSNKEYRGGYDAIDWSKKDRKSSKDTPPRKSRRRRKKSSKGET